MPKTIKKMIATEFIDSRGWPTIGITAQLSDGALVRASVPAGASVGAHEVPEKRDNEPSWYSGRGVRTAVNYINTVAAPVLVGQPLDLAATDAWLNEQGVAQIGANTALIISVVAARAQAIAAGLPLWKFVAEYTQSSPSLPRCMANILNGGAHASNGLGVQEIMIVPPAHEDMAQHVHTIAATYHALKKVLQRTGRQTGVGDEGGFAPVLPGSGAEQLEEALNLTADAVSEAGLVLGKDLFLACDVAASELYDEHRAAYNLAHFAKTEEWVSSTDLISWYERLAQRWPLVSIEDGLDQDDWRGWQELTTRVGRDVQLVGDDIFVTNTARIQRGVSSKVANSVLIKPNQVGTVTATFDAIKYAQESGYRVVVSHRSGETNDSFIADLAVGVGADFIKLGAPCRGERTAKYNRLIAIALDNAI